MAREHGTHGRPAAATLVLVCIGLLAVGLLVPAAAASGGTGVDHATNSSNDTDGETETVAIDLSSWFDGVSVSATLELPSVTVSWIELLIGDLAQPAAVDEAPDDDGDVPENETDDGADGGTDESDDRVNESDGDADESDDSAEGDNADEGDDAADEADDVEESDDVDESEDGDELETHEAQVEGAIHDEINQVRADHGLESLAFDDDLAEMAREHSEDMAERDYFSHTTPEGETVGDRYAAAGVSCQAWGENILYNTHGEESPEVIAERSVQQWMDSDDHRENILDEGWDSEGIGVAIDDGELYATQKFGTNCN